MKYNQTKTLTNFGTDIAMANVWRAASIYDPDSSGVGHQPHNHDTWEKFYKHYTVLKAVCVVKYYTKVTAGTDAPPVMVYLSKQSGTSLQLITREELGEHPETKKKLLMPGKFATLKQTYSRKRVFGSSKRDALTASFGSNPAEDYYFVTKALNAEPGVIPPNLTIDVNIYYTCMLTEPLIQPLS